jgi:hypothetical protein
VSESAGLVGAGGGSVRCSGGGRPLELAAPAARKQQKKEAAMDDVLKSLKDRRFNLTRELTRVNRAIKALEPEREKAEPKKVVSAETRQKMSVAHRKPRAQKSVPIDANLA